MAIEANVCSECGASHAGERTCADDFNELLAWEANNPDVIPEVHHLTVLCYHLQHPTLYSPEGLAGAKGLLVDFVERGLSPLEVRRRDRSNVASNNRSWKITGTPERHGSYANPVLWPMTASDVVAGGESAYCDSVRAWAQSALQALKESGNLAS